MTVCLYEPAVSRRRAWVRAVLLLSMVASLGDSVRSQDEFGQCLDSTPRPAAIEAWRDYCDPEVAFWSQPPGPDFWTIDYRCRTFCSSNTCYEFGMPPEGINPGWSPLSRLNFSLNSCWHGLKLAHETPTWGVELEWMMAGQYIQGVLEDYDWDWTDRPPNPDGAYTDLGFAQEQFTEGQMIDLGYKFQLFESAGNAPLELWPMIGFRWQRFDIMTYDLVQVKSDNEWLEPPDTVQGDVLTFNQQYYVGYAGVQLRGRLEPSFLPPLVWTVQGDWGYTEAYNTDHHLLRSGDRYTMERTHGDCWHAALTVEALLTNRIGLGVQADHLQIRTTGVHRWFNEPFGVDESWSDGVFVSSRQTWITAFVRIRM